MLSLTKLAMPIPNRNSSNSTINTRRRSAKAMTAFMLLGACLRYRRLKGSAGAASAVDEQGTAGDDLLAGRKAGADLDHAVAGLAGCDHACGHRAVIARDPDPRGLAFVDNRALRHCRRDGRRTGDDAEAGEHHRLQRGSWVLDIGAHRQTMGVLVDRWCNPRYPCREHPVGIGWHADLDRRADAHELSIRFTHIGHQPHR